MSIGWFCTKFMSFFSIGNPQKQETQRCQIWCFLFCVWTIYFPPKVDAFILYACYEILVMKYAADCVWPLPFLRYKWVKNVPTTKIENFDKKFYEISCLALIVSIIKGDKGDQDPKWQIICKQFFPLNSFDKFLSGMLQWICCSTYCV